MKIFRTKSKAANFWLDVILITAILAGLCFIFFWPIRVAGSSMSPAINMGDQLIISRFSGFLGNFGRGDIVLARIEADGGTETVIKRIAAVPGEHLIIEEGGININIILGDDEFFLLGDNLDISSDSRHFGPVSGRQIVAKILLRYFPLSVIEIF
ncbi:MAG: signal peptidase I [Clostridiales bacterium]|jgi:signal peptidase I|nr:signal peptidase I [Clostridiales bacterium]